MRTSKKASAGRPSCHNHTPLLKQIRRLADDVLRGYYERRGLLKVGATKKEFDRLMTGFDRPDSA